MKTAPTDIQIRMISCKICWDLTVQVKTSNAMKAMCGVWSCKTKLTVVIYDIEGYWKLVVFSYNSNE